MTNHALEQAPQSPQVSPAPYRLLALTKAWFKWLYRFLNAFYFDRVTLLHSERRPQSGPVLYLGLHRNGAVDGFVYHRALNQPLLMISTQLRKSWFARLFFHGIAVTRTKDKGDRSLNDAALRQCLEHLQAGGELFVLPEGTSSLGPRHLPFKSGAAWLLLDYLSAGGPPLRVVPAGIHYECPWAFRSRVEVVLGPPISTDLPAGASRIECVKVIKARVQAALEVVGVNVVSDEYQQLIQQLATVATLTSRRSYFNSLKALESAIPEDVAAQWRSLEAESRGAKLWLYQGVPLFPSTSIAVQLLALVPVGAIVLAAALLNLPPLLAGWFAGKQLPDDRNVISLWRILAGVPTFVGWVALAGLILVLAGKILWLAACILITWAGLKLYRPFKRIAVAAHNGLRRPALRARLQAFRQNLLRSLPDEAA